MRDFIFKDLHRACDILEQVGAGSMQGFQNKRAILSVSPGCARGLFNRLCNGGP